MDGLSIILPNYNGKHLFEKYFEQNLAVFASLEIPYEIIIVDDASTDDSIKYLKKLYTDKIILIEKETNSGFSKTCNLGIHAAKYSFTFLLNTDVLLTQGYFKDIFKYFKKGDTFGVMGRVVGMNDEIIQEAARLPKLSGQKIKPTNFYYIDDKAFFTPTLYLSGAIALIDTNKLKELKGFNEILSPFYGEDFELCLRAWRLGWKSYYHHDAICRHEISGSTKNYQKKYWIKAIYFRNRYFVHYLHLNGFNLLLWHFQVFFTDVIASLITLKTYKVKAYLKVWRNKKELTDCKKSFSELMRKHQSKKSLRVVFNDIQYLIRNKKITKIN